MDWSFIKKFAVALTISAVFLGGICAYVFIPRGSSNKVKEDTVYMGNTPGNLYNNGMFCERNDYIYFANPYDDNKLYRMNSDCTKAVKLNDDSVRSINVTDEHIFYIKNNSKTIAASTFYRGQMLGVMRTNLKGQKSKTLYNTAAGVINSYGDTIYYQHYTDEDGLSFYKVDKDGKNEVRISDEDVFPACIYNDKVYYSNSGGLDHDVFTYDTRTGYVNLFAEINSYKVIMEGDFLYYIDLDLDYSLVRMNTHTFDKQILVDSSEGRVITYNIYDDVLFYHIEGNSPALYRMNKDGSNVEFIKYGNITQINCTSTYTFFQIYGVKSLYRVKNHGDTVCELLNIE